ncbi:MAG: hypothetical protein P4M14_07885 [Gammaproteobacteria bacterium]|nr:hypothetical protein [Gammaproteobacteria bacterium]
MYNNKNSRDNQQARDAQQRLHKELHDDFESIKQKMRETREALSQTAYDVSGKAEELLIQSLKGAKEKSSDIQDNVVTYVKANPVKSIGYAFLCGVIAAKLLHK